MVRDYVHAEDVASAVAALVRLADVPPVCNIGSGVGHSVGDVLDLVEAVTGRSLPVERLADRGFDVRSIVLDVTRLGSIVDWHPRHLRDGISDTWVAVAASRHHESFGARPGDRREDQ
jgi:UDP-glucose 4-epimerase